jgi:AraC-like DNA-binding protein
MKKFQRHPSYWVRIPPSSKPTAPPSATAIYAGRAASVPTRRCQARDGCTLIENALRRFARQRRLERARRDLCDPRQDSSVARIAQRWGFANQSTFIKAYREQFGLTPGRQARRAELIS